MEKNAGIYVAGHRSLVGSAIVRRLHQSGYENLLLKTRAELDLTNQQCRQPPAFSPPKTPVFDCPEPV